MVKQCFNNSCWTIFQDHGSNCISCGYPLIFTPDSGSPYENSPQAQIDPSFGGIPHDNLSPANSSPFFRGQKSPSTYGSPTTHDDALPAFALPHSVPNLPALRSSPAIPNLHSSYQRSGYSPSTAIPPPYPATSVFPTIPNGYLPSSAATLNHSSQAFDQSGSVPNTSFEIYDPKADKTARDKMRSCISCYRSNRQCHTDEGESSCQSCAGKPKYCRGVIQTPDFKDTEPWFQSTAALIAGRCRSLDMILDEVYLFDIQVKLNVSSQEDDDLLKPQKYHLDLRGLREYSITNDDHSKLAGILDMVFPSSTTATEESRNANLESCKCFGRRFVSCLMTLRNFRVCTLNTALSDESIGPYIMLEFLRQLNGAACYLFGKYFEALNNFLEGPRHKKVFKNQLFTVACTLGQIHNVLKAFDSGPEEVSMPQLDITALHRTSPVTLDELQHMGTFFNSAGFRAGSEVALSELPGIHIELFSPEEGLDDRIVKRQPRESATFLDILRRSFDVGIAQATAESPTKAEGSSISVESPCQDATSVNLSLPPHQFPDVESQSRDVPSHERQNLEEQSRQLYELQSILEEENQSHRAEIERHKTRTLELAGRISLLSLSLGLDVHTQNSLRAPWPVEKENDQPGPTIPESSPSSGAVTLAEHSQDHNSKAHVQSNSGGDSDNEHTHPSPIHREATEMTDMVMSSSVSGHGSEDTVYNIDDHVAPAVGKRKRISDYFPSFKKHRVAEVIDKIGPQPTSTDFKPMDLSQKLGCASNDSATTGLPIKMRMSQIFTSNSSLINRKMSASEWTRTLPCKDIVPPLPRSNPGSERPLSWPRSSRWRKSFGVSVKALREGFEKMKIAQVEPVPPLPPSN